MTTDTASLQATRLSDEFLHELIAIADWWLAYSQDSEHGGFHGEVDAQNQPLPNAPKGVVLNTRILWFFSEVAQYVNEPVYQQAADRAYHYLMDYFVDPEHGGVFWSLTAQGQPLDTKKQIYAQAFSIYALCAYYQLTGEENARKQALACFDLIESRGIDPVKGGYLEAFTREWQPLDDLRLSEKDLNFPKTMNTHLHVLEAYTSLHTLLGSPESAAALTYTLGCFDQHIINHDNLHQRMFMDMDWQDHSTMLSYGHDIECSWLLYKALTALDDPAISQRMLPLVTGLADTCLEEALGLNGELVDACDIDTLHYHTERVWWVQAEALAGFITLYTLTGKSLYLKAAEHLWQFIKTYQMDHNGGEWLWFSRLDKEQPPQSKASFWKCPYHNGRAMLIGWQALSKH